MIGETVLVFNSVSVSPEGRKGKTQVRCEPDENVKPILAILESDADMEYLIELVGITRAACPVLLRNLQAAVRKGDLRGIEKGARLVRAAAESVLAERTYEAAIQLEMAARRGRTEGIPEVFLRLQWELERLKPALAAFAESLSSQNGPCAA